MGNLTLIIVKMGTGLFAVIMPSVFQREEGQLLPVEADPIVIPLDRL